MEVIDNINRKYGSGTLLFGSEGIHKPWRMKRNHASPNYLTKWNEVLRVG